jgi:hypothetical protein
LGMPETAASYCTRCARDVDVVRAWPGFLWAKRAWYAGLLLLCCLMPVILSEITLLLPLAMVFAAAAGPVHSLAAQRPSCRDCGFEFTAATKPGSTQTP